MPKNSPTMRDIARLAGVSVNTVSRVLNGKRGVGSETRARILNLIEEEGYHANLGARSLRGKHREGCVGVTLPVPLEVVPVSQPFLMWIFSELYRVFGAYGERICFDLSPHSAPPTGDYARSIWEGLYTVCLVGGPLPSDDTTVERIHASGIPYLALSRLDRFPLCSCATVDYEQGAYLSTKHLLGLGHTKIAMLRAFSGFQPGMERSRGYLRAMKEAGIAVHEELIRPVTFGITDLVTTVHRVLLDKEVTALIDCSGTEDAASLREGARRAGRVVGRDFDVLCWTYASRGVVMPEACAHLWLPVRAAAAEGLDELARWRREERDGPIHIVYPPVLYEESGGEPVSPPKRVFDTLK